jgi:Rrf2 family nitric oxide-sensitive transcriptional repressor
MRLTSFTDFGLRALMRLAAEPEHAFTTEELAEELAISRNHLVKIVRNLGEAGFVTARRGKKGGFRLAQPAQTSPSARS